MCHCGHVFAPPKVTVTKDKVIGQSPIVLPSFCVKCGRDDVEGQRRDERLGPGESIWVPAILWPLFAILIAVWRRKGKIRTLQVSYFLCDDCAKSRRLKTYIGIAALLVLLVPFTGLMVNVTMWAGIAVAAVCFCGCYLFAILWLFSYRHPLKKSGCKDGLFTVKGTSEAFHATMKRLDGSYQVRIRTTLRQPTERRWWNKPLRELTRR